MKLNLSLNSVHCLKSCNSVSGKSLCSYIIITVIFAKSLICEYE